MRTPLSLGLSALLFSPVVAFAITVGATFPDVSDTSPFHAAISALAQLQIVKGNADGTFAPGRSVNRAEFLTLLYRAKSVTPAAPTASCFKDVPANAWFAGVVCDAALHSYVAGYSDKTFKPEQAVNKVEALKMLFTVMGLAQGESAEGKAGALAYSDVNSSAWYMTYLVSAFKLHILPLPGMMPPFMGPDKALSREEAAGVIYNAIFPTPLSLDGSVTSTPSMQLSSAMTSKIS
jgi:hypothetical protein